MGEDERNGFAGLNPELPACSQVFTVQGDGSPEDKSFRSCDGIDHAVVEPGHPWHRRSVIEADHKLSLEIHTSSPAHHDAQHVSAVSHCHEVHDCGTSALG